MIRKVELFVFFNSTVTESQPCTRKSVMQAGYKTKTWYMLPKASSAVAHNPSPPQHRVTDNIW
jgi:hypothetical protein